MNHFWIAGFYNFVDFGGNFLQFFVDLRGFLWTIGNFLRIWADFGGLPMFSFGFWGNFLWIFNSFFLLVFKDFFFFF